MGIFGPTGVAQQRQSPRYRNNCANFVSQALLAGGLETTEQWRPSGMEPWLSKSGNHAAYAESASPAWMNVKAQYRYFSDTQHGYTSLPVINLYGEAGVPISNKINISMSDIEEADAAGVHVGDPIYFYSYNDVGELVYEHAAMISSIDNEAIKYTANTSTRYDRDIRTAIKPDGYSGALIIRIGA